MTHEEYMKVAIEEAKMAVDAGNAPFGVVVVDPDGKVVWKDHDRVNERTDPTAHGEINAIRSLCSKIKSLSLRNYTFYTTSEPCPTCLTGCIKAQVSKIYFGAETESTASLPIKAVELAQRAKKYPIHIQGGILAKECKEQRETLLNKMAQSTT